MHFQATIRYGTRRTRYHRAYLEAEGLREALRRLAEELPDNVLSEGDLIEVRPDVDPDRREYVEGDPRG